MTGKTKIEWTDATWNPIVGCSVTSPGCTHCYAMQQAARVERMTNGVTHYHGLTQESKAGPVWTGKTALASDKTLTAPLRWKKPRRIFVNSMGDLFHPSIPDEWIDRVFAVMALARLHTFQVLTKQSARMRQYLNNSMRSNLIAREFLLMWSKSLFRKNDITDETYPLLEGQPDDEPLLHCWPLSNVWLGVSVEDQKRADERIPDLLATPAAVRFISAEPLLGPVDIRTVIHRAEGKPNTWYHPLAGRYGVDGTHKSHSCSRLDWVIVGGESGPNARPMHPDWVRAIRDQCAAAGTAFFFKQWGGWGPQLSFPDVLVGSGEINPGYLNNGTMWAGHGQAGSTLLGKVGKRAAGRLLDGIEHNAMPERAP